MKQWPTANAYGARGVALLACAALVSSAWAQRADDLPALKRVLVTAGLQQKTVFVVSLSEQELVSRDAETGASLRTPLSSVRALLPVMLPLDASAVRRSDAVVAPRSRRAVVDDTSLLVLSDAETLPGHPGPAAMVSSADALPWQSAVLGQLSIPLDGVRRMLSRRDLPAREPGATADRLYLRNGDALDGFVELVTGTDQRSLSVTIDADGHVSTIPWANIVSIEFAATPREAAGAWAWLEDGTSIAASSVAISTSGDMTISWSQGRLPTALPSTALWAFVPDRKHVDALSACSMVSAVPGAGRRWADVTPTNTASTQPLSAEDIDLSGPVAVTWDLGVSAQRVAGTVEMAPADRVWGDCIVIIEAVRSAADTGASGAAIELWKGRINAQSPAASFNLAMPGSPAADQSPRVLRVRIEEGENGPAQDRVLLRRVLIER